MEGSRPTLVVRGEEGNERTRKMRGSRENNKGIRKGRQAGPGHTYGMTEGRRRVTEHEGRRRRGPERETFMQLVQGSGWLLRCVGP